MSGGYLNKIGWNDIEYIITVIIFVMILRSNCNIIIIIIIIIIFAVISDFCLHLKIYGIGDNKHGEFGIGHC